MSTLYGIRRPMFTALLAASFLAIGVVTTAGSAEKEKGMMKQETMMTKEEMKDKDNMMKKEEMMTSDKDKMMGKKQ